MTRLLSGRELAGYIKERQAKQVRALRQSRHIVPTLAIINTTDNPVNAKYIALKQAYGQDIQVEVQVHSIDQSTISQVLAKLNADTTVHGILVQLPLANPSQTAEVIEAIDPTKDVDGLGERAVFEGATALAIRWLLSGYNIELRGTKIVVVGQGRLVGGPLTRQFIEAGYQVTPVDDQTPDVATITRQADVIITATGVPGLLTSDMIGPNAVVVDAGVSTEGGKLVGDVAPDVYERQDITITPKIGGVGPLTVCALFDNVIRAAS